MFDIGFWELAVLGVIGLIVLGPERLPVVARTLGRWASRARHYVNALTTELENEVATEDIRRDVRRAREQIEAETQEFRSSTERAVSPLMEPIEGEAEPTENASGEQNTPTRPAAEDAASVASDESSAAASDDEADKADVSATTTQPHNENRP
ncbi:Sec-independent protein translocase protein TatB [Salinisphaera sp. RV14]|uniref:Sec-independent protein translocase protein TatB n=1 Tax=unclassified Salinisphaera TaxID=2649847 RepID=UPI003F84B8CB